MKRRTFLGTLGGIASLSGCLGASSDQSGSPSTMNTPAIHIEADPVPDAMNVGIDVTVQRQFGPDRPARVRVTFRNLADETRTFSFGSSPPFDEYVGARIRASDGAGKTNQTTETGETSETGGTNKADEPAALLVPDDRGRVAVVNTSGGSAEYVVPTTPTDGCWKAANEIAGADVLRRVKLNPGESLSETYTVLAHADNEACLPQGEYRFEASSYLPDGSAWGFSLIVSEDAETTTR